MDSSYYQWNAWNLEFAPTVNLLPKEPSEKSLKH